MSDRLLKESDVLRIAFQLPLVVNSAFADAVKAIPSVDRTIDADSFVTVMLYDDEHEEYYTERMTIAECLDRYTEEGCPWKGADNE